MREHLGNYNSFVILEVLNGFYECDEKEFHKFMDENFKNLKNK